MAGTQTKYVDGCKALRTLALLVGALWFVGVDTTKAEEDGRVTPATDAVTKPVSTAAARADASETPTEASPCPYGGSFGDPSRFEKQRQSAVVIDGSASVADALERKSAGRRRTASRRDEADALAADDDGRSAVDLTDGEPSSVARGGPSRPPAGAFPPLPDALGRPAPIAGPLPSASGRALASGSAATSDVDRRPAVEEKLADLIRPLPEGEQRRIVAHVKTLVEMPKAQRSSTLRRIRKATSPAEHDEAEDTAHGPAAREDNPPDTAETAAAASSDEATGVPARPSAAAAPARSGPASAGRVLSPRAGAAASQDLGKVLKAGSPALAERTVAVAPPAETLVDAPVRRIEAPNPTPAARTDTDGTTEHTSERRTRIVPAGLDGVRFRPTTDPWRRLDRTRRGPTRDAASVGGRGAVRSRSDDGE